MYKKLMAFVGIIMLLVIISGYNSTKANKSESYKKAQTSISTSIKCENINLQFVYPKNTSKEQSDVAKELYSQVDNSKLCTALEKYISESISDSKYNNSIYKVKCSEYYNDFDGDGKNELFVYRSVYLPASTPDYCYRELWYTDGETVKFVMESSGRNDYSGVIKLDNGPDLFYYVPEIVMGAPCQTAKCYIISGGKPVEYVLPDKNQYFAFYKGNKSDNVYIDSLDDENGEWEISKKSAISDKPIQTFSWVKGEIKIVTNDN